jgi:CSLREA domain-containing protein
MARRASLVLLLTLAGLVGLDASPAAAVPTTHTVTTTADTVNGGDGVLSLREAVDAANADAGDSAIVLLPGQTHQLTRCVPDDQEEVDNVSGDLNSAVDSGALSIVGGGATIRQTCPDERVLRHAGEALDLSDVTITGGDLTFEGFSTQGGGIDAGSAPLTLTDSTVTGNGAALGGGIAANELTLVRSAVTDNTAAVGGAVYVTDSFPSVTVTDSSIVGNTASSIPGINFTQSGTAVVTNSTFGGSTIGSLNNSVGSELNVLGSATITHSTFVGTVNGSPLKVSNTLTAFGSVVDAGTGTSACTSMGTVVSLGYNVEAPGESCEFDDDTDQALAADSGLGALADNGGAGDTFLPDDGGVLDGMIPVADCDDEVTADARAQARPSGAGCEPGAVELPALRRPDGHLRNSNQAAFGGNDTYNSTGAGQTRSQNRRAGQKATFFVRLQNDGDEADGLRVRGPASSGGFTVRYLVGSTNVTNAVTHAGHVFGGVVPGGTKLVRVEVTATAASRRNATKTLAVRATSLADPTRQDVVKASVRRT